MIEIIPAIDMIGGRCVRLTKGDYAREKVYDASPLEMALEYSRSGVRRLHLVDLDGAKCGEPRNLSVLTEILSRTPLKVEYGGGIRSTSSLEKVIAMGASWAIIGSTAGTAPEKVKEWAGIVGPGRLILGVDFSEGKVATHGWMKTSSLTPEELMDSFPDIEKVLCTDISRDGMLQGVDTAYYAALQAKYPSREISVSGGISSEEDILRLEEAGLRSVIVGKAIYEGRISMERLRYLCTRQGNNDKA